MATIFTHAVTAGIFGKLFGEERRSFRFWFYLCICAMLPDADVLGFRFGINYEDFWGHRGFTHSIVFACILGLLIGYIFYRDIGLHSKKWWKMVALYSLVTASHGFFDALTDGGLGVAFFSPFDNGRYFLPWTPIQVSPIGIHGFLKLKSLMILWTEILYVILPMLVLLLVKRLFRINRQ